MSIKLQKENIRLSQTVCSRFCQTTAESDIIVPDINPDILKVLRAMGEAVITEKTIHNDRVHLKGVVRIDILYIPESNDSIIKSISACHDFSHTIDVPGAKPEMTVSAEAECENTEYSVVNSRKLNIKCKIGINVKVCDINEMLITTGIDEQQDIQTHCEHIKISNCRCQAERDTVIRQRLEVPAGKPDLTEILKFSSRVLHGEHRILDDKAIVRGDLLLSTLYCGNEGESTAIECMEHTIPFTEVLEIPGMYEGMTAELDYSVKNIHTEICRDSDGDKRLLDAEITLGIHIRGIEMIECDAITDVYGINCQLKTNTPEYTIEQLVGTASQQITVTEKANVPDYLPDIYRVCHCTAVPYIENVTSDNSTVTVSGYISCNILYMSSDCDNLVSGFCHIVSFSQCFDIEGMTQNSVCEARVDSVHLDYTIGSPRSLDLRSILNLSLIAVTPRKLQILSDIEYDEDFVMPAMPSITVYYIQPGDTLWNIAKRFRTTVDNLLSVNSIDPDNLQIGSRIFIFR